MTEVIGYPAMLADVPDEINEKRLRAYEWFNGVAGFGGPDDTEIFERNQIGLACDNEPWLVLTRGMAQAKSAGGWHRRGEHHRRGAAAGSVAAMDRGHAPVGADMMLPCASARVASFCSHVRRPERQVSQYRSALTPRARHGLRRPRGRLG